MDFINKVLCYRNTDKTAIVFGEEKISYERLINSAARFADYLSSSGINRVVIKTAGTANAVTAALGVLFSGGIFAFLSKDAPADNIDNAAHLLEATLIIDDDIEFSKFAAFSSEFVPVNRDPDTPICAVFTSGSTGMPKGALLTYRGLCETTEWQTDYMQLPENSHTGSYAGFSFIASFWEIWYPLSNGFTLYIADNSTRRDTKLLVEFIDRNNLSYIFLPSDVAQIFSSVYPGGALRFLRVAGGRLISCGYPVGYEILYSLGMSENSGSVTFLSIKDAMDGDIPIGKPFGKTEIYLIDGEMAVSGPSLFAGYASDDETTSRVLVDNPYSAGRELYKKMYMSGDLAKLSSDGNLTYIGRRDWIVKINNIKTNPIETERVILDLNGVDEAAVIPFFRDDKSAYLTCFYSGSIEPENFPKNLENKLPPNAIPSFFIKLPKLPKNPNGKIDRNSLKMPEFEIDTVNFSSENERKIATAFEKILGRKNGTVGPNDGFIRLGGNSLGLMRLQAELMKNAGLDLKYSDLFTAQTPAAIAAIKSLENAQIKRTKPMKNERYNLTAPERQMWLLWRTGQDNGRYTVRIETQFDGKIDRQKATSALSQLVENYPVLSSYYIEENGGAFRLFSDVRIEFSDREITKFDLKKSPLFAATIIDKSLIISAHHIIADAAAMRVLAEDFWALYSGKTIETAVSIHDLETYEASLKSYEDEIYWKEELEGRKLKPLPTEIPQGEKKEYIIEFTAEEAEKLKNEAARKSVTLFVLFTAAATKLVSLICKCETVCIGIPVSGRDLPETIRSVGMLVKTLPLVIDVSETEIIGEVSKKFQNAFLHQNYPFEAMNEKFGTRYDVMVNYIPLPQKLDNVSGLNPCIIRGSYPVPATKLVIDLREEVNGFSAVFTYDAYEEKTAENFANAFRRVLFSENSDEIIFTELADEINEISAFSDDFSAVWSDFFKTDGGSFYDLGGTSLKAIQIEEAMLSRGLYISAADILQIRDFDKLCGLIIPADEIDWEEE